MRDLLARWIETRRAARRTTFAIAQLRLEAARAQQERQRDLSRYFDRLADLIERTP